MNKLITTKNYSVADNDNHIGDLIEEEVEIHTEDNSFSHGFGTHIDFVTYIKTKQIKIDVTACEYLQTNYVGEKNIDFKEDTTFNYLAKLTKANTVNGKLIATYLISNLD